MRYPINCKDLRITSDFGYRYRSNGKLDFHPGIDIGVDKELWDYNLYPIADNSRVALVGYDQWRGNFVILEHATHCTRYVHMKEPCNFKTGDIVHESDVIGVMGNTGASEGVHLHFEVHRCHYKEFHEEWTNGEPRYAIDPEKFFMQYMKPKHMLISEIETVLNKYK